MQDNTGVTVYEHELKTFEDILIARKKGRELMESNRFSTLEQTKFITAMSELFRNVIIHATKGSVRFSLIESGSKFGIRCIVTDKGPGIQNINQAMVEGFSTIGSLGLGLSGAKNLSDDFSISSSIGVGTTVNITKWR